MNIETGTMFKMTKKAFEDEKKIDILKAKADGQDISQVNRQA